MEAEAERINIVEKEEELHVKALEKILRKKKEWIKKERKHKKMKLVNIWKKRIERKEADRLEDCRLFEQVEQLDQERREHDKRLKEARVAGQRCWRRVG